VNLDTKNTDGYTPLLYAVEERKASLVRELLQYPDRIDINGQSYMGNTALQLACMKNLPDIVQLLLDAGCNINIRNNLGFNAFHIACLSADTDIVRIFIRRKDNFDINSTDNAGNNAFHLALEQNHVEVVRLLLEAGIHTISN